MAINAADYLAQLTALLPKGPAWLFDDGSLQNNLLTAWSEETSRVDRRCDDLANESDPRSTAELLPDWERIAGLPDPCVTITQTIEQRHAALTSKLTQTGGQSRAYFIALAAALGYPGATIDETFGVTLTCNSTCNDSLGDVSSIFIWRINLPGATGGVFVMTCNSDCNSSLQSWGNEAIECRINKLKPAHTTVLFAYI